MNITLIRYYDTGNVNTRLPEKLNAVQGILPPLGLAYLASSLEKARFKVEIIDAPACGYHRADIERIVRKNGPQSLVGVTSMTSSFFGALEACRIAHECGAITVMGGVHMEAFPRETLSNECIDFGICGEAENSLVALAEALRDQTSYDQIPGIVYRDGDAVVVREPAMVDDLDALPFPARHLLPNDRYSSIIGRYPVTTMIASRGCPFHCHFCYKQNADKRARFRSPENVLGEMQHVVKQYGVREIMFYDDTLTMNRSFVESLCRGIIDSKLDVAWEAPSRIDCVDRELLKLMRRAHCRRLRFGVESGDPRILKLMNKKISLERVEETFRLMRETGIETFAYFIIGYLTETPETMRATIRFAKKIRPDLVMFTLATPYPATPLYDAAVREGLVEMDYWRDFVLGKRNDRLPCLVPDAQEWVRKAYHTIYFDILFIWRRIARFRSWHDVVHAFVAWRGLRRI